MDYLLNDNRMETNSVIYEEVLNLIINGLPSKPLSQGGSFSSMSMSF